MTVELGEDGGQVPWFSSMAAEPVTSGSLPNLVALLASCLCRYLHLDALKYAGATMSGPVVLPRDKRLFYQPCDL